MIYLTVLRWRTTGSFSHGRSAFSVALAPISVSHTSRRSYIRRQWTIEMARNLDLDNPGDSTAKKTYGGWSNDQLILRVEQLENELKRLNSKHTDPNAASNLVDTSSTPLPSTGESTPRRGDQNFDFSKYSTRFIALKFAYLGQRYNGFEHANGQVTPLPAIEEILWKALKRAKLINPPPVVAGPGKTVLPNDISWQGCEYSKCGRTDRGVSAFGQVIGIRVRSNRPLPKEEGVSATKKSKRSASDSTTEAPSADDATTEWADDGDDFAFGGLNVSDSESEAEPEQPPFDDIRDELPYISILNSCLPEDIRILAWCPNPPPGFDARFSCAERRYKYFFTQPAFLPTHGPQGFLRGPKRGVPNQDPREIREGYLDIEAMREAAKHLEGSHDFRNMSKLDTSKQLTSFTRVIYHADIEEVDPSKFPLGFLNNTDFTPTQSSEISSQPQNTLSVPPKIYTFTVHGSAFLWHQVRHMIALLFLVGQGLEPPSSIPRLMDISSTPEKPHYDMANDYPLVLWDCLFPAGGRGFDESRPDALEWVYAGDPRLSGSGRFGLGGIVDDLWMVWRQAKMNEILTGSLLDLVASRPATTSTTTSPTNMEKTETVQLPKSQRVFEGSNQYRMGGTYVDLFQRPKVAAVEVQNARWRAAQERKKEKLEAAKERRRSRSRSRSRGHGEEKEAGSLNE